MNSRIPYEERPVLRVVPADNELGFELEGEAPLRGGWFEVSLSGSPSAFVVPSFGWEIIKKVNRDNPGLGGGHWMTDSFTFSRDVDPEATDLAERSNLSATHAAPVFRPMLCLTAEFKLLTGPLPEKAPSPRRQPEITGRYMVVTPFGPGPVRASFKVGPGSRVGFFSPAGKEHFGTVSEDGKTLINIEPPIDPAEVVNTTIAAMPPGDMPVIRGVDPDTKTIKVD